MLKIYHPRRFQSGHLVDHTIKIGNKNMLNDSPWGIISRKDYISIAREKNKHQIPLCCSTPGQKRSLKFHTKINPK